MHDFAAGGGSPCACYIICDHFGVVYLLHVGDCSRALVDLVFVVDSSGSVGAENFDHVLSFINAIINKFNVGKNGVRIALTRFSSIGESIFNLNTDFNKASIQNRVNNTDFVGGGTDTAGGIRDMHFKQFTSANGDRPNVQNIAIIITDGRSSDNAMTISEAIDARNDGIDIVSVGISHGVDENELRQMSSSPQIEGQNYWRSVDFDQLDTIVDEIVEQTCSVIDSGKKDSLIVRWSTSIMVR